MAIVPNSLLHGTGLKKQDLVAVVVPAPDGAGTGPGLFSGVAEITVDQGGGRAPLPAFSLLPRPLRGGGSAWGCPVEIG